MNIVILDAHAANPGDLSWSSLEPMGDVTVYPRTSPAEIVERGQEAEVLLTNKVCLTAEILEQLPKLKYIGVLATGINVIDIPAAVARNIVVTNVPGYSTASVAQLTISLILDLACRVAEHSASVMNGDWIASEDFSYTTSPIMELAGKRLGLVGYGATGQGTAGIAAAMGMDVAACQRTKEKVIPPATYLPLDELLATSDIISLHCPLTQSTENLIREETLRLMKPTAWLINTARGPIVKEDDLAKALSEGWIAAAALDVLSSEPMRPNHPLLGLSNCLITPHIAWATKEARSRLLAKVTENLVAWKKGTPQNRVA
ncbi:MAG: D-2-hydroxyacid dehydrogenase [Verrucomicrobiota bacterium]